MRTITEEYKKLLENSEIYRLIVDAPRPDFTQLHKENMEFEKEMIEAQMEDKKKMLEALHR